MKYSSKTNNNRRYIKLTHIIVCNFFLFTRYTCHQFLRKVCQNCAMVATGMQWAPNKVNPKVDEYNITKIKEDLKTCPKCQKKFQCFEQCHSHQKREHYGIQYEHCDDCDTTFASKVAMELHAFWEHGRK